MAKPSRYQAEFDDRYGIVMPYLRKFVFEDKEEFDYTSYYESESDDEDIYGVAEPHEAILKYLKQIRESFGFDVDCRAPSWFDGPFTPVNLAEAKPKTYKDVMETAYFAIREINAETSGKTYKFVELKKAVFTINFLSLLTITVKEVPKEDEEVADAEAVKEVIGDPVTRVDAAGDPATTGAEAVKEVIGDPVTRVDASGDPATTGAMLRTIQAIVYLHVADGLELEQWRIKPDPAADEA